MTYPILHFREPLDEETVCYMGLKGYYDGVTVEVDDGSRYPVYFYDPVRLRQDLELQVENAKKGWEKPFVAEVAMVVVQEITEEIVRTTIQQLYEDGWFENFQPIRAEPKE